MTTFKRSLHGVAVAALLGGLSASCQLIVDFNRGLIDAGDVDATFDDGGDDAGFDGGEDALPVPDAVSDVVFSEGSVDARKDVGVDAHLDGGTDATLDANADGKTDAPAVDAPADTATHDAHDGATLDAHEGGVLDGAPPDALSDALGAG